MPEMTVQAEVSFEVWCDTCGAGLCRTVSVKGNYIYVPPCEKCMEGERVNGREEKSLDLPVALFGQTVAEATQCPVGKE